MSAEHRITTLDSGVRVVTERVPGVRSVALGFWIATGSVAERDEQAGISHLLEHMLFRGTERYGSQEIDQIFDAMGAEINAGTDKEATSLYTRVLDRHLERAFDVMSDMVWQPRFGELEAEREVVLEEIAMYEDDPQDRVFDVLGEAVFGSAPARARGDRHRRGRRRGHARAARAPSTPQRYRPAEHRDRGRRLGRARRARGDGRASARPRVAWRARQRSATGAPRSPRGRAQAQPPRRRCPTSAAGALPAERHRAVPRVPRRRRDRARRRAALRAARARRRARRHLLLAAVPGGARAPRAGLLGVLASPTSTRTPARSACTSARARTTSPRRSRSSPPSSSAASRTRPARRSWCARARTSRAAWCSAWSRPARA